MENLHIDQHISRRYNQELEDLRNKVMFMGGMVERQCKNALKALINGDSSLAESVATSDYRINSLEVEIDAECTEILARRQPAASDLRMILTVIKTITDLERIGDEAEKIGRYAIDLATEERNQLYFAEINALGDQVKKILRDSLNAFARLDVASAFETAARDKHINKEYDSITRKLIKTMTEDSESVERGLKVMWCARALERIGDHAKNICEYVIFTVEGKDVRHTSFKQALEEFESKS